MTASTTIPAVCNLAGRPLVTATGFLDHYPDQLDSDGGDTITTATGKTLPADAMTPLPAVGEFVTATADYGTRIEGYWLGAKGESHASFVTAWLLAGDRVQIIRLTPDRLDARTVVTGTADDGQRAILNALAGELRDHQLVIRDHEQWRGDLIADLHTAADEHDLCPVFDQFCEDHGLPRRVREYDLSITVTLELRVTREAESVGEAIDSIDRDEVLDVLENTDRFSSNLRSWDVEED